MLELLAAFDNIKTNAPGVDGFSFRFLKLIWPWIDAHILHVINHILTKPKFRPVWKCARTIPVRKSGKPLDPSKLRIILSFLLKVFEHIIKEQTINHLHISSLLSESQHRFKKRTNSLLLTITAAAAPIESHPTDSLQFVSVVAVKSDPLKVRSDLT